MNTSEMIIDAIAHPGRKYLETSEIPDNAEPMMVAYEYSALRLGTKKSRDVDGSEIVLATNDGEVLINEYLYDREWEIMDIPVGWHQAIKSWARGETSISVNTRTILLTDTPLSVTKEEITEGVWRKL